MNIDLGEFLPPGERGKRKAQRVDLSDLLDSGPPPEPEIFSDPVALELHTCVTTCRCGAVYHSPEGVFAEVILKRLHTVGFNHYYKEVGHVLVPLASSRSKKLLAIPHRTRARTTSTLLCSACIDSPELYEEPKLESNEEWEVKRPAVLSKAWKEFQLFVNPSREKLNELIAQIEARERYKDAETPLTRPQSCDPEQQLEE